MLSKGFPQCMVLGLAFLGTLHLVTAGDPCPNSRDVQPCKCTEVKSNSLFEGKISDISVSSSSEAESTTETTSISQEIQSQNESRLFNFLLSPRRHSNPSYYTIVECKQPKSPIVLEEVVTNGLHRRLIDKMIISNLLPQKEHNLVRLPEKWLENVRVKQLVIRDTVLSGDFIHYGTPLKGQEYSLLALSAENCYLSGSLSYNTIGTVNTMGLELLTRMEVVDFSRNRLVHISDKAFRQPSANLSLINLSYNSIQTIDKSAFSYVRKLKRLDLSNNLIESLARNIFPYPANTLQEINLNWNRLKSLPLDFFNGMPSLKIVKLGNNFLYSLPPKPWTAVWKQLYFVDLLDNFVECNCDLLWLVDILSKPNSNTSTAALPPHASYGQTILGSCTYTKPQLFTISYQLDTLKREQINCNV